MTAGPREGRSWPGYLFGGRLRTSTLALIIAFIGMWWLYSTYESAPPPPEQVPASEVVPPGFIPDPAYTWVPRTYVQRPASTTPTTSPTTTPTTPETASTTPTSPTATGGENTTAPTASEGAPVPGPTTTPSAPPPSPSPAAPQPSTPMSGG